jgi:hypothetical protein
VLNTYSWGNEGEPGMWYKNRPEDINAAYDALWSGTTLNKVGDSGLVQYVYSAFYSLAGISSQMYYNFLVTQNCWGATNQLLNTAQQIQQFVTIH